MRPDPDQAVLVIKRANEHIISSLSAQGGQLKTTSTKLSDLVETIFWELSSLFYLEPSLFPVYPIATTKLRPEVDQSISK